MPAPAPSLLIVEDEFVIANGLRRIAEKAGYQCLELAESVAEAQALAGGPAAPTVALLDIFLKGEQTGLDLAHWLRERDIPFVFLSANLTDAMLAAAKLTQPLGFLNKPFRERDVLAMLELACYHQAQATMGRQRQHAVQAALAAASDGGQLALAAAAHFAHLLPSCCLLSLRLYRPSSAVPYDLVLSRVATGDFEVQRLPPTLRDQLLPLAGEGDELPAPGRYADLTAPDQPAAVRAAREHFGVRALGVFEAAPLPQVRLRLLLGCTEPAHLTAAACAQVQVLLPSLALALDKLVVSEENATQHRLRTAELTLARCVQPTHGLPAVLAAVATTLRQLLPLDALTLRWPAPVAGPTSPALTVHYQDGQFCQLTAELPDLTAEQPVSGYPAGWGIRSGLAVPLAAASEPAATLLLASRVALAYGPADLATLREVCGPLALALENRLIGERLRQLAVPAPRPADATPMPLCEGIVGDSPALRLVLESVAQVAPTNYAVLVLGETGTGKELVARAVHSLSPRRTRPLVQVNCAALPAQLIESELFGHERGSYTGATEQRLGKFELADGGTIFLDEVGELPLELQAKLLRVLQEGQIERLGGKGPRQVNVRVVAATNRDLAQEVRTGRFRADLYYRLHVFPVVLPPLRERPTDVLPLARHFLVGIATQLGRPLPSLSAGAQQQLRRYAWPGNVRELQHVLERAAILHRGGLHLELAEPLLEVPLLPGGPAGDIPRPAQPLQEAVREAILAALTQANYRIRGAGGAAELLHLKPTTLEARMRRLQIGQPKV